MMTEGVEWIPKVMDEFGTIRTILKRKASIGRLGDGEIRCAHGRSCVSQRTREPRLTERLKQIMHVNEKNFLVGIPRLWERRQFPYTDHQAAFWAKYAKPFMTQFLSPKIQYYSQGMTRPDMAIDIDCELYWDLCLKLWEGRDVVFAQGGKRTKRPIEGDKIFAKVKSIVDVPGILPADAYHTYDELLPKILSYCTPGCLVYLGIGPTATVLAYDIWKAGFQALDMGHFFMFYHKSHVKSVILRSVRKEDLDRRIAVESYFREKSPKMFYDFLEQLELEEKITMRRDREVISYIKRVPRAEPSPA